MGSHSPNFDHYGIDREEDVWERGTKESYRRRPEPPAQGAEGGLEGAKKSLQGSTTKKWRDAFLKYSPTGKSSKPKTQSSSKDEPTDIRERSPRSGMTTFQKFAERARILAGRKARRDLKDNLWETKSEESTRRKNRQEKG
ncbi:uncharacterized protein TNCT_198841 [Trichonephila clavata]|uniref:Uncharacterized protein n=1 Tax=Trichonephila clavata TaxID=2740835 RepID=A0A8X6LHM4_TRICU|nr:uncharacterized protein TNCT_198841 [Trichonephila clavata]